MNSINFYFSIYTPIYIYLLLIIYFIFLIISNFINFESSNIYIFQSFLKIPVFNILFLLTLLTLLGTPPTIGFFAKLLSFWVLVLNPSINLLIVIILTLILLIFYLQIIRTRSFLRKQRIFKTKQLGLYSLYCLISFQGLFLIFFIILPIFFDLIWANIV